MRPSSRLRVMLMASLIFLPLAGEPVDAAARSGPWKFGQILIEQAWARIIRADPETAAVYLTINNKSSDDDVLLAVDSPAAQSSAVYASNAANGVAVMEAQPFGVSLPGRGEVALRPGGIQVLLRGVSRALKPGDALPLRLVFRDLGSVELEVRVALPNEPDPAARHIGHRP